MKIKSLNYQLSHKINNTTCNYHSCNQESEAVSFKRLITAVDNLSLKNAIKLPFIQRAEIFLKKIIGLYNVEKNGTYRVNIPFLEPYNLIADDIFVGKNCVVKGFYKARKELDLNGFLPQNSSVEAENVIRINSDAIVNGRVKSAEMLFIKGQMSETSKAVSGYIDIQKGGESAGKNIADTVIVSGILTKKGQIIADNIKELSGSKIEGTIIMPDGLDNSKGA